MNAPIKQIIDHELGLSFTMEDGVMTVGSAKKPRFPSHYRTWYSKGQPLTTWWEALEWLLSCNYVWVQDKAYHWDFALQWPTAELLRKIARGTLYRAIKHAD